MFSDKSGHSDRRAPRSAIDVLEEGRERLRGADEQFKQLNVGRALRLVEDAIRLVDERSGAFALPKREIRKEAACILTMRNEPAEAERYIGDVLQSLATAGQQHDVEFYKLQVWRGTLLLSVPRQADAEALFSSAHGWAERNALNSALHVQVLLGLAHLRADRGDASFGAAMSEVLARVKLLSSEDLSEVTHDLTIASWYEERSSRFESALALAESALEACDRQASVDRPVRDTIRLHIADMAHHVGAFGRARHLRTELLNESIERSGAVSRPALFMMNALAETCCEQGDFEAGEHLFLKALDGAESTRQHDLALRAGDALSTRYLFRGMREEAEELCSRMQRSVAELSGANRITASAETEVMRLAQSGDGEAALMRLDELFAEAEKLQGLERQMAEASLSLQKAWVLSDVNPSLALEAWQDAADKVTLLPATLSELLAEKVDFVELYVSRSGGDPDRASEVLRRQINNLGRREGKADFATRSALMGNLASVEVEAGRYESGLQLARQLVTLHEDAKDTQSAQYAMALHLLAVLLGDDSPEYEGLKEKALEIAQRKGLSFDDF